VIVATAGHVDHGKTSLIRQLTGVETDTLAEERERGLSINLGYAYLPRAGGSPLGFIDVPGHQRFINTMISGISGIDMGLMVVAADDGPMPQTLEHLDVLEILGVNLLTVVISKIDRASTTRVEDVESQVRALLTARPWQNTRFFPVSSTDGSGVADLRKHLLHSAEQLQSKLIEGGFRLSIDRCFTARGSGLIVTGTASAGTVSTGDRLRLLPGKKEVRVRGLRAHNEVAEEAQAGQRVALNLSGKIEKSDIERGDWLVDPDCPLLSSRLDVVFSLQHGAPFPLKHLAPIKLHIGAGRVAGRLAIIEGPKNRLQPGDQCLAQLILDQPVSAMHGERYLLRDQAEDIILGGGNVLDPVGPRYGKSRPGRLAWLRALQLPSPEESLAALLAQDQLVELDRFWAIRNRPAIPDGIQLPLETRQFESDDSQWAITGSRWEAAGQRLNQIVNDWHRANPQLPGMKMNELKPAMTQSMEPALAMAVLVSKIKSGDLSLQEGRVSLRGFKPTESGEARAQWQAIRQHLEQCRLDIPPLSELREATRIPEGELRQALKAATKNGDLHRLNDTRYALPEQLLHFSQRVVEAADQGEELSVVKLKSRFGSGRKLTIELLEYFDSIHFTRREGDRRIVVNRDIARERFGS
jgi:selenocysteine-specific elongation factor